MLLAPAASAQVQVNADDEWCRDRGNRDRGFFCEVREVTTDASASIEVSASPNGGVQVVGWDRGDMRIRVRIAARADTDAEARDIAKAVDFEWDGGTIRASGPPTRRDESWSASFRLSVPQRSNLRLESVNGGLAVESVTGQMALHTTNGGIELRSVGGDVQARTTNGGLSVALEGSGWDGAGLEARTVNGGITLFVPDGYSANLETGTTNGGMNFEFPVTMQGRMGKRVEVELGSGGAPISAITKNGGVTVRRN
jgi:hypothetical protein